MSIVPWVGVDPQSYIPGRQVDQIMHRGFTAKRAPVLTRSVLWRQTIIYNNLDHDDRQKVDGYVDRLRGGERVARVPFGFHQRRRGGGTGTPTVSGAHVAGAIIVTSIGWSGTSAYLERGDCIGFQVTVGAESVVRVHRITDQVTSGDLDMNIWPPLREDLANGAPIYFMPSTVGGGDGRLQPAASTSYLEVCMSLEDPEAIETQPFPSNISGHYGLPSAISFIEAVQDTY